MRLVHSLFAFVIAGAASAQVAINNGQPIPHANPQSAEHFGSVVALNGDDLAVSAPDATIGAYPGAVFIYTRTPTGWQLQATLTPPAPVEPGQFGRSLSLDSVNGAIAIGSQEPYTANGAGTVYLFKRTGTAWNLDETFSIAFTDFFGFAVALEGDTLVISDTSISTVRVYQRQPQGFWSSTATLVPPPDPFGSSLAQFGYVLALRGDRVVVGSPAAKVYVPQYNWNFPIGEVEVYVRSGTSWPRTASVHSHDYGGAGTALAFDGEVLAMKSWTFGVDIYRRSTDSNWIWEHTIADPTNSSTFGASLALSGEQLLISTPPGATLYEYQGAISQPPWIAVAQFGEPTMSSVAGAAVGLSGTSVIIGDKNHVNGAGASGDAFAFECAAAPQTYCIGKLNSDGCLPTIVSTGLPSVDPATFAYFWIDAEPVVPQKNGLFFYGAAPTSSPFHGGTLCVAQPVRRTALTNSGGSGPCSGQLSINFATHIQSGVDPALIVGANVFGQWWYRDPASPLHFGFSNGIQFTIWP